MSTHFYPRPPPTPSSPIRPSTAHSTIRAVTPSPPHFARRPKSEHALGSTELATFARYVVKAEEGGFVNTPRVIENGGLRRGGGIRSGRTSPVKSRSASPRKSRPNSPQKSRTEKAGMREEVEVHAPQQMHADLRIVNAATPSHDTEDEYDEEPPLTPTPMTREQKRHAYTPLSVHRQSMARKPVVKSPSTADPANINDNVGSERVPAPINTTSIPPIPPVITARGIPTLNATTTGPILPLSTGTARPTAANSDPVSTVDKDRISRVLPTPTTRLSTSPPPSTSLSATSNYSIFSTPGRDELERKKAMVEEDEGPFGRVKSMGDLVGERERVGSAGKPGGEGGKKGMGGKMGWKMRGCGMIGCVVM